MLDYQCDRCGRWIAARRYELLLVGESVVREYLIRCSKCRARYQIRPVDDHDQRLEGYARPI